MTSVPSPSTIGSKLTLESPPPSNFGAHLPIAAEGSPQAFGVRFLEGTNMDADVAESKWRPLDVEDRFYEFLAGGCRATMLPAMIDLGLDRMLYERGSMSAPEIVAALALEPTRGKKWVLLLKSIDLLVVAQEGDDTSGPVRYTNGPLPSAMATPGTSNAYFYREFLRYWRVATSYDIVKTLRGAPILHPVRYPPVAWDDTVLLHEWMRSGALQTLKAVRRHFDFSEVRTMLDVGGGDATMACKLASELAELQVTVFNVPQPAYMARQNISTQGLVERVKVVEGDFRKDPLPEGFELVLYSRVLADWPPDICRMLLEKAHNSLLPGGRVMIAEPLRDQNPNLAIAWEHSYLPYDDFGAWVYKPLADYVTMLTEIGFTDIISYPRDEATIHSVIIARKPEAPLAEV